jgi:hypothetical protein
MLIVRAFHTASLLPNGQVLIAGGNGTSANIRTNEAELYDPGSGTWITTSSLNVACEEHTSTILPDGRVLVLGGFGNNIGGGGLTHAELYDWAVGSWSGTGGLATSRTAYGATLLTNGKVLVVGGSDSGLNAIGTTELYNPAAGVWSATGPLNVARVAPTITLLRDGRVLAAGGSAGGISGTPLSSAEIYNPNTGLWTLTGSMSFPRSSHTATLLSDGRVLVAGGSTGSFTPALTNCEIFDPGAGTWAPTGSLNTGRSGHAAVLVRDGTVLVAAGSVTSSEIYTPATGKWSLSGTMFAARAGLSLIPMPTGNVLAVGGDSLTSMAEMWNFPAGNWTPAGSMSVNRSHQAATLLSNGKVLVAGGFAGNVITNTAELYDPALNTWTLTGTMGVGQYDSPIVFLPSGKVLEPDSSTSELYNFNLGFNPAWQPQIATETTPIVRGANLAITGTGFRGISEASGGNTSQNSSSDDPLVQLRSIEGGQWFFLPVESSKTNWSATFVAAPETFLPAGNALLTLFVNGIPSATAIVDIVAASPIPFILTNVAAMPAGFQFQFTNVPLATFTALSTTNLSAHLSNWTPSGVAVSEISPGHYQFTDPAGTNGPQRFYIVRSP